MAEVMEDSRKYILEVQAPFSRLILIGKKSIETRAYNLPEELLGVKILLCESEPGLDGISGVGNIVIDSQKGLSIIGEIIISQSTEYKSQIEWDNDRDAHQVPKESSYEWAPTESGRRFGWRIQHVVVYDVAKSVPAMTRM